jgi:hypothetical protein
MSEAIVGTDSRALQAGGHRFDPGHVHQSIQQLSGSRPLQLVNICEQNTLQFGHRFALSVLGSMCVDFERRRHMGVTELGLCHSKRNAPGVSMLAWVCRRVCQPMVVVSASLHAGIS